ncbi:unnamed protein product [Rotaria magnacalcarata]|uniref:Uncharacterized protein n=1 Tax=Rotaria magnacalcarata TaxID=392030 RepID=A0A819SZB6_9BILA|nr:unnamed protein product [Rotaria magnacalcarata]CAF4071220.1 unnamed protein product [Rotaria magnacalcarata]
MILLAVTKIFLPALGILLISLSIVIVLFQEFNIDDSGHRVTTISNNNSNLITLISEICEVILALIISVHSIFSLQNLCKKENNLEQNQTVEAVETVNIKFKIDFLFLLIAYILLDIYCGLTFVGSVLSEPKDKLTQYIRRLTLTASVIPTIQTTLQLVVIWKARQYKGKLTGGINDMWIILSFAIWLFDTFSAKGYKTNEIQKCVYYGAWDYLAPLFIPMAIFFRFHSCIMFANIKAEAYWVNNDHLST